MALALAIAIPAVASIALNEGGGLPLYAEVFLAGFSIVSVQFSLNAVCAIAYPVDIRASAIGVFFVVGRVAGIAGPLLISVGLSAGLPAAQTLDIVCAPLTVALVAAAALAWRWSGAASRTPVLA